jgi:hypothetical protein
LSLAAGTSGTNGGSDAVFKRGGTRATASGRLGWTNGGGVGAAVSAAAASNLNRKRFSEWSVDMLCHWLETIGLGQVKYEYRTFIFGKCKPFIFGFVTYYQLYRYRRLILVKITGIYFSKSKNLLSLVFFTYYQLYRCRTVDCFY